MSFTKFAVYFCLMLLQIKEKQRKVKVAEKKRLRENVAYSILKTFFNKKKILSCL